MIARYITDRETRRRERGRQREREKKDRKVGKRGGNGKKEVRSLYRETVHLLAVAMFVGVAALRYKRGKEKRGRKRGEFRSLHKCSPHRPGNLGGKEEANPFMFQLNSAESRTKFHPNDAGSANERAMDA